MRSHGSVSEGVVAGLIGATTVALWFLVVDVITGHPLFTPDALGGAVLSFFGPAGGEGSMTRIAIYTVVHYAAFVAVGIVALRLVHAADRQPSILSGLMVLFAAFELGFYGLVALLSQSPTFAGIAWYQVGAANLVAAAAMGWYIWRSHPHVVRQLDVALRGGE